MLVPPRLQSIAPRAPADPKFPDYAGESAAIFDPVTNTAYIAFFEGITAATSSTNNTPCQVQKTVRIFYNQDFGAGAQGIVSKFPNGGGMGWQEVPDTTAPNAAAQSPLTPDNATGWLTDPSLAIGGDGTVYLAALYGPLTATEAVTCDALGSQLQQQLRIWTISAQTSSSQPTLNLGHIEFCQNGPIPQECTDHQADCHQSACSGNEQEIWDHPKIAASPVKGGEILLSYQQNGSLADQITAFEPLFPTDGNPALSFLGTTG